MDLEEFNKRVAIAIQKESLKKSMADVIWAKLGADYYDIEKLKAASKMTEERKRKFLHDEMGFYFKSLLLYLDQDDRLREETYRLVTCTGSEFEIVSYPQLIKGLMINKAINIRRYTYLKFERSNKFLSAVDNADVG